MTVLFHCLIAFEQRIVKRLIVGRNTDTFLENTNGFGCIIVQVKRQCFHFKGRDVVFVNGKCKIERINGFLVLFVHRIQFANVHPTLKRVRIKVKQAVVVLYCPVEIAFHFVGIRQIDKHIGIGFVNF
ncbi:hypothetical protein SDC9_155835 [bioreactor metagenome]|uniref:Uncharacterized protein n=1 Tax=bioreactor metagenome TaxID=1076179 RepID=A0A645F4W5_9ZZZZ